MKPNQLSNRDDITESTGRWRLATIDATTLRRALTRVKEGDDHGDDESKDPSHKKNSTPRSPTNKGVTVQVLGVSEKSEKDEAC